MILGRLIKNLFLVCIIGGVFSLVGCKSAPEGLMLYEQRSGLSDLRKAVVATIGNKMKYIRKDNREFISIYYDKKGEAGEGFDPQKTKERRYTQVVIWGDRRPFDVQIRVFVERRTPNGYEVYGEDLGLEKKFGDKFMEHLKSLGDKTAIDEMDPFK
jgi:hypothetical protein